jgi:integrase
VANEFLERHASKQKKHQQAKRVIENEFIKRWGPRPVTDIRSEEVSAAIKAIVKRKQLASAHNAFAYIRRLFSWAIGCHEFGIEVSPCDRLKPNDVVGEGRVIRNRFLTDDELRAVWNACDGLGYPSNAIIKLLILTGQRLREIANVSWSELDLDKALLIIPPGRMKNGRAHAVPLAPQALAIFKSMPRFKGPFVFTTTGGRTPFVGFTKAKRRLDAASGVTGWVLHDVRRTVRTNFGALPVPDNVRELIISHTQTVLRRTYDLYSYLDEKRECLRLWEARLSGIVAPPTPADVIVLTGRQRGASTQ